MTKTKHTIGISIFQPHEDNSYEGSYHDSIDDHVGAARRGMPVADYEDSARDRIQDKAGEKHMRDKHSAKTAIKMESSYKSGKGAFATPPKVAHGYGYKDSQRKGHLRMSGSANAHRLGSKKGS